MRVFLSSTAQDLVAYRRAADDTILRLSQQTVLMERFGPLPGEPVAECERKARESDLVICIVAHRYGYEPEKGRGSITRREVEAAHRAGKQVLVFIVDDNHPWTEKKEQDRLADPTSLADPACVAEVAASVAALIEFRNWLRATFICDSFTTPDDLGRKIAVALSRPFQPPVPASTPPRKERIRNVHALQPAPHFKGRDRLLVELREWVADLASPDRVWSLVAAGGTGKTAVVERLVREMQPSEANVIVWSFYVRPDADAFLRECNQLFLGEEGGPAGGRLERLERGLRDGRPHLIVLDGLERVQEDAGNGRVRGELSDQTLKLLLRALAAGLGRARALVTSRFPLVDLQDWTGSGYRSTPLDDLAPEAAVAVLRGWGITGDDAALRAASSQVGNHALSVAVIGSYLRSFASGDIAAVARFKLDTVTGDDPKAAKLARVLAFYAERLPPEERELLARLSVFPRGVTLALLAALVDAGGKVAGVLGRARPRLFSLLCTLKARGLVFEYQTDSISTWTAHPFLRDRFGELLGCPPEKVFELVAAKLGTDLEKRPETKPSDPKVLDRYEELIEATRLAGREQDAFDLYSYAMGNIDNLGWVLGEYQRGYRILATFSPTGQPGELARTLPSRKRHLLVNELALFALRLGRLSDAWTIRQVEVEWVRALGHPEAMSISSQNSSDVAFELGHLAHSLRLANKAVTEAEAAGDTREQCNSIARRARALHAMGNIAAARDDFTAATKLQMEPLYSLRAACHVNHILDLGDLVTARAISECSIDRARRQNWNDELPQFHALLARIDLAEGNDPTPHLDEVRAWTSRTGEMELIVEAHLLFARNLLAKGNLQAALDEAEAGLVHAASCGYGLLRIELLIAIARIGLAWPDPPKAIQAAREALDLATHPDCGYSWGKANAAQVWGQAYAANHEPTLAKRAFTQAIEVRRRIQHPGTGETEEWLARIG
jgi:tetratricopeptide (TPR) repeat protein